MRKMISYGLLAAMTLVLTLGISWAVPSAVPVAEANPGTQWNAQYFNGYNASGPTGNPVVSRIDDAINFNWANGSPDASISADGFAARWTKTVNFPTAGQWTFRVGADDGVRMWIDTTLIIDEWHDATGGYTTYTATLNQLTAGNHDLKVEYYEATGLAGVQVLWESSAGGTTTPATGTTTGVSGGPANWAAQYFNNATLAGSPVLTRTDNDINFNWAEGSPGGGVPNDNFSARWEATVNFPTPGVWTFRAGADDGIRVWVDNTLIIDEWHGSPNGYAVYQNTLNQLTAGNHVLKVEYYEATGLAGVQVRWSQGAGTATTGTGTAAEPTPEPVKPIYAAVTASELNVRQGPGRGYPSFAKIVYPENYVVLGAVPDMSWIKIVLDDGREGWVSNEWVWLWSKEDNFVKKIPRLDVPLMPGSDPTVVEPGPVDVRGTAIDTLRLRDGASLVAAQVIGSVPQGQPLTIEAQNYNGAWLLVSFDGIRGWVSTPWVRFTQGSIRDLVISNEVVPAPPPGQVFVPQTDQGAPITVRGRALSNLRLRDAASLRGQQIGSIPQNAEFVVEGRNRNGAWYLLTWEGQQGWVNSPYVTLIEGRVSDLQIR